MSQLFDRSMSDSLLDLKSYVGDEPEYNFSSIFLEILRKVIFESIGKDEFYRRLEYQTFPRVLTQIINSPEFDEEFHRIKNSSINLVIDDIQKDINFIRFLTDELDGINISYMFTLEKKSSHFTESLGNYGNFKYAFDDFIEALPYHKYNKESLQSNAVYLKVIFSYHNWQGVVKDYTLKIYEQDNKKWVSKSESNIEVYSRLRKLREDSKPNLERRPRVEINRTFPRPNKPCTIYKMSNLKGFWNLYKLFKEVYDFFHTPEFYYDISMVGMFRDVSVKLSDYGIYPTDYEKTKEEDIYNNYVVLKNKDGSYSVRLCCGESCINKSNNTEEEVHFKL